MKNTRTRIKLFTLLAIAIGFVLVEYPSPLAQDQAALHPTRGGLNLEITDIRVPANRKPVVTFRVTDSAGLPLDRTGLFTEGPVIFRIVLARIDEGNRQYTSYTMRMRTGDFGTVEQAWHESDGTYVELADGLYEYTFRTVLPEGFNPNVTHTVAIAARRDLTGFDGRLYFANAVRDFVPAGSAVTTVRDIVRTDACNQCHNSLAAHGGGFWREVRACVLCHQPQSTDHETGNPVNAPIMFHKIHMGADLPSVIAGVPYRVEDEDFSTVKFPPSLGSSLNNLRNCARCHTGSQGENWMTRPSRSACGSCHDDVNFATGENHLGGPQPNDNSCHFCHPASTGGEFDISVAGAHTVPLKSNQLPGTTFQIVSVANTKPGENPTVSFNIKDKSGNPMAPGTMDFLRLTLAGPTTDYADFWQEDARGATGPDAAGNYSYTFARGIPLGAQGTYAVGIEGYKNVTLNVKGQPTTVRDVGFNRVAYLAVTDSTATPRRQVVDVANCNRCHDQLAFHGTVRRNTQYCILCHNPNHTDGGRRPVEFMPAETVHFKVLVHKIHRGEELENEYKIIAGSRVFNFNEVRFPGDLKDCGKCHLPRTKLLPLPSRVLPTVMPRGEFRGLPDPTLPITSACTACHDSLSTAAHANTMTAGGIEACATCHGEGKEFAVSIMHAKVPGAVQ